MSLDCPNRESSVARFAPPIVASKMQLLRGKWRLWESGFSKINRLSGSAYQRNLEFHWPKRPFQFWRVESR